MSVERYDRKQREAHFEDLERQYLAAACNEFFDAGVRISEGAAEVVIEVQPRFLDAAGAVHPSVCFTALADAALLAVNSLVRDARVVVAKFDIQLNGPLTGDVVIARSRFVGMSGQQHLAESILTNSEGHEVGTGNGAFEAKEKAKTEESTDAGPH